MYVMLSVLTLNVGIYINVFFSVEKTSYIAELKKSINIQDETINELKATIQNVRIA